MKQKPRKQKSSKRSVKRFSRVSQSEVAITCYTIPEETGDDLVKEEEKVEKEKKIKPQQWRIWKVFQMCMNSENSKPQ